MNRVKFRSFFALVAFGLVVVGRAWAAIEVLDAYFRPDRMLPEWNYFFSSSYKPGDVIPNRTPGGSVCVYLRNTGGTSVTIDDFVINGTGLKNGIRCKEDKTYRCDLMACSVYYPHAKQALIDAGEPVWWRVDPNPIPPGGTAEVFVRMRYIVPGTLTCSVVPTSGSSVPLSIPVSGSEIPRIVDCCFSPDMTKLYLYLRHPERGTAPSAVYVDGVNVTSNCTIVSDPRVDLAVVKCNLAAALSRGSYHVFQAEYPGGTRASFGLRVYSDNFKYGTSNAPRLDTDQQKRDFLISMGERSINLMTEGVGDLGDFLKTAEGKAIMDQYGMRKLHNDKTSDRLWGIFCCDEPDCGEPNVAAAVAPYNKVGTLAQAMVNRIRDNFRGSYAVYPCVVNLNSTNNPYQWYNWGHVPDIFSMDPYYMARMSDAYWYHPNTIPFYRKATYIYAFASTCKAACEPRLLHIILQCTRRQRPDEGRVFRWPTPEEQHICAYYAVAAGAKQIAYWWLAQLGPTQEGHNGCAANNEPGAVALWREMGLIGAELGLVGSIIVNSSPADFAMTKPGKLWIQPLLSGVDTMMLVCVNDDYSSTDAGITIRPVHDARVSFDLPNWLSAPASVFEADYRGVRDLAHSVASGRITLELGTIEVARMVIITKDGSLKSTLQSLYSTVYGPRVAGLVPASP